MHGRLRRDQGQELVEYAIIFIVLMTLVLGVIEFGVILFTQNSLTNAAREGARFAVARNNQPQLPASSPEDALCNAASFSEIVERACTHALGLDDGRMRVIVTWPAINPATTRPDRAIVSVQTRYSYQPFFGLIGQFLPGGLTLGSQSTMRLE